jgi:beta-xylosidase
MRYKKPDVGKIFPISTPEESDEFNGTSLGFQWQWMANPKPTWYFMNPSKGVLRLYAQVIPDSAKNLWQTPNVLLQKFPAEEFRATAKMDFKPNMKSENEKAGLAVMGFDYANIGLKKIKESLWLVYTVCKDAEAGSKETEKLITKVNDGKIYLRVAISKGGVCQFSYSFDNKSFTNVDEKFVAKEGKWIGAKTGIFCSANMWINDAGYSDFDWFRIDPL